MAIQYAIEAVYLAIIATFAAFIVAFYFLTKRPRKAPPEPPAGEGSENAPRMERSERTWLYFLLAVVVLGNLVTFAPLLPSATETFWNANTPVETILVEVQNYTFLLPESPIRIPANELVEFRVVSHDVTYGFGVFRHDGTMVFQMTVIPQPYTNVIRWIFTETGDYDIRSTEYSGPLHSSMHLADALIVESSP